MLSSDKSEKVRVESNGTAAGTPTATATGTPSACSSTQSLTFTPETGSAVTGHSHKVTVTVNRGGNCSGKKVYLEVASGANNSAAAAPQALDSKNQATLSYVGTQAGTDSIRVWLDYAANTDYDVGEPTMLGKVTWTAATPTRTSTPTRAPTASGANTAGGSRQSSPSKGTPTPTKSRR